MNKTLVAAWLLSSAWLASTPVHAGEVFRLQTLPANQCHLKTVEMTDPQLCLKLMQQIQDECTQSGGSVVLSEGRKACKLPSARLADFNRLIGKHTSGTGPYNPAGPIAATVAPNPKGGCIRGTEHLPASLCNK
jgi:hypothetical protein